MQKTCEVLIERTSHNAECTQLARLRKYAGMSQAYLAKLSGVSLRSIQMYEQRNKDIVVAVLANVVGSIGLCHDEELADLGYHREPVAYFSFICHKFSPFCLANSGYAFSRSMQKKINLPGLTLLLL